MLAVFAVKASGLLVMVPTVVVPLVTGTLTLAAGVVEP
jgi:hypothetical protein